MNFVDKDGTTKVLYSVFQNLCFEAVKIVHNHGNGHFDGLISAQQSVVPLRL